MKVFLEIKNIKKHFGEGESRVEVLKGIDIEIEKGEFCVLLGPSGSGKSTLLNIIGGIDAADEGYISINGEKTADMNEKALTLYRRKHLGYIFQMYNLIPNLNIKENIYLGICQQTESGQVCACPLWFNAVLFALLSLFLSFSDPNKSLFPTLRCICRYTR